MNNTKSTTHPSGAVGVKEIALGVPRNQFAEFVTIYQALTGLFREKRFTVGTPFGEVADITLEPYDEDNARITMLEI